LSRVVAQQDISGLATRLLIYELSNSGLRRRGRRSDDVRLLWINVELHTDPGWDAD